MGAVAASEGTGVSGACAWATLRLKAPTTTKLTAPARMIPPSKSVVQREPYPPFCGASCDIFIVVSMRNHASIGNIKENAVLPLRRMANRLMIVA